MSYLDYGTIATGLAVFLALGWTALMSAREGEPRAAVLAAVLSVLFAGPFVAVAFIPSSLQAELEIVVLAAAGTVGLALFLPLDRVGRSTIEDDVPRVRFDERDVMFSRNELRPDTARYAEYYAANPEKKAADDAFRAEPGLLSPGATAYDRCMFGSAEASFWTIERLRPHVDGEPADERAASDPDEMTGYVKEWTRKLGARSVGVTELREYHLYRVAGRGEAYGRPVELEHDHAIAFTVEMAKEMVDQAPLAPTVMESAQQYVNAGVIAVQLARFIRNLGYNARAHIDGNYRVVCPLVARDAGLGAIGRMGLLMTPELGPRVRLGVVTTDLPLRVDGRTPDGSVIDFCTHCRKCAEVCPPQAIPFEDRETIGGVRRWQIDQEACFTFWCRVGTDCARCMAVCPYSHPDNALHRSIRSGVRRNPIFRRLAIKMDDLFYGVNRPPARFADWMQATTGRRAP